MVACRLLRPPVPPMLDSHRAWLLEGGRVGREEARKLGRGLREACDTRPVLFCKSPLCPDVILTWAVAWALLWGMNPAELAAGMLPWVLGVGPAAGS